MRKFLSGYFLKIRLRSFSKYISNVPLVVPPDVNDYINSTPFVDKLTVKVKLFSYLPTFNIAGFPIGA